MLLMATVWPMTMAMVASVCANNTTQVHIHDARSYKDRIGIYMCMQSLITAIFFQGNIVNAMRFKTVSHVHWHPLLWPLVE